MRIYPENLTAATLYAMVKDLPRDARPMFLVWDDDDFKDIDFQKNFDEVVDHRQTSTMFVGSMTAWLVEKGGIQLDHQNPDIVTVFNGWNGLDYDAPTLIEALAAACKGVTA